MSRLLLIALLALVTVALATPVSDVFEDSSKKLDDFAKNIADKTPREILEYCKQEGITCTKEAIEKWQAEVDAEDGKSASPAFVANYILVPICATILAARTFQRQSAV